jgi:hypothetical protein
VFGGSPLLGPLAVQLPPRRRGEGLHLVRAERDAAALALEMREQRALQVFAGEVAGVQARLAAQIAVRNSPTAPETLATAPTSDISALPSVIDLRYS